MDLLEITASGPVLCDGGWGTELQKRGLPDGECPDRWNLVQPARVVDVARSYVEAGSAVILTNTFRSNRVALEHYGLSGEVAALNRAGVRLSREAAQGRALVFASMGTTGKLLALGDLTEGEM